MPVVAISNQKRSNLSDTLTMGLAGAGIGAGVGYFAKPSLDSFTKAAKTIDVKDIPFSKKVLKRVFNDVKNNGFEKLSQKSKDVLLQTFSMVTDRARAINTVKAGVIGAGIAVGLFAIGLMMKPNKKRYLIIEDKKS